MRRSTALVFVAAFLLGGCAIHPLPEDVTRNTTADIVHKIQCEGREALDNISIRILRSSTDQRTLDLADRVAAGELTVIDVFFNPKYSRNLVLNKDAWALFGAYTLSAVTFDFDLMIAEENNHEANADFQLPLVNGLFTLGANAGAKFDRKAERKFQITNSFYELHKLDREYCTNIAAHIGNMIYPITGKIGLEEVFVTFIGLDSTNTQDKFTDDLTFTTTLTGGANPKITLNPIQDRRFSVVDASATLSATRMDQHEVSIALARGPRVTSLDKGRLDAKTKSKSIADQKRMENLIIIPRDKAIIVQ
jgi:hypothetical protein